MGDENVSVYLWVQNMNWFWSNFQYMSCGKFILIFKGHALDNFNIIHTFFF